MDYLIRESNLINVNDIDKSRLLTKPLNIVKHEGGVNFLPGDQAHRSVRAWIADYAAIVGDKYTKAADLPAQDTSAKKFGSEIWLKLTDTLPAWGDKLLQVDVYAWDPGAKTWESAPIATSDRGVWGKGKLWQHNLTLLASKESDRAKSWKESKPAIPKGKYLIKAYVDLGNRVGKIPDAVLGINDFVGQAEIDSAWPESYGRMTTLDARKLRM